MRVYTLRGANIVVGGKRFMFAPLIPVEVPQETADYLLSTGRFYKEGEVPPKDDSSIPNILRIGVSRVGGIGDALLGSCVITAIHRKFLNSQIVAHSHSTIYKHWQGHPSLHHMDSGYHPRLNNSAYNIPRYDVFYDLMPNCNVEYNKKTIPPEIVFLSNKAKEELDRYKRLPGCVNHLKPFCNDKGFEALDVFNFAFGTNATIKDMYLLQEGKDRTFLERKVKEGILPEKYITIHDWAFNGRQTKSWFPVYWKELNECLRKTYNLPIIQIGGAAEENLYADYDLRGKTTFGESVELLKHSVFHVDNESTPAHVCASIGTPCIVLCGSTLKYWRHKENLNIVSPYHCQECEGAPNWYKVCADNGSFGCMKALTPEYALEKIVPYLKGKV